MPRYSSIAKRQEFGNSLSSELFAIRCNTADGLRRKTVWLASAHEAPFVRSDFLFVKLEAVSLFMQAAMISKIHWAYFP